MTIAGTDSADTITIGVNSTGGIHVALNGVATDYAAGAYSALEVESGAGADSINVQGTAVPATITSAGPATVAVGNGTDGLQEIGATVTVTNSSAHSHLVINDASDIQPRAGTIGANSAGLGEVSGLSAAPIDFSGNAIADLRVIASSQSGNGPIGNTFAVQQTLVPTTVQAHAPGSFGPRAIDRTVVGLAGTMQRIAQPLTVVNGLVTLDDSSDASARQVAVSVSGTTENVVGLSPAAVSAVGVATVAGTGLTVGLPAVGGSSVQVNSCFSGLGILSGSGPAARDSVGIGHGSLAGIQFPLYVQNTIGSDDVTVDESSLSIATVSFGPAQQSVDGPGLQVGPASSRVIVDNAGGGGNITWRGGNVFNVDDLSALPTGTLSLEPGLAGGNVQVFRTPAGSTINVTGRGGSLQVQDNPVDGAPVADGALNISNEGGTLALNADDYLDFSARHVTMDTFVPDGTSQVWERVTGLLPGAITYDGTGAVVQLVGGRGGTNWDVLNTPPRPSPGPTNLYLFSQGSDSFTVSGTGANTNLKIDNAMPSPAAAASTDTVDFVGGAISNGSIINIAGENGATLIVRGASASDLFIGNSNMLTHGASHVLYSFVNSVHLQSGTFQNVTASNLELDGADTSLMLGIGNYSFAALTLDGAEAIAGGNEALLSVGSLLITDGGQLDVTEDQLQITFPAGVDALSATRVLLQSGYNNGSWNGPGIVSSTLDSSHGLLATLLSGNKALVRSDRYGDANLDGDVDFSDLLALAQNYGQTNASWTQGDFDYDGTVGFSDLLTLAQNYGTLGSIDAAVATPLPSITATELPNRRRRGT